MTQQEAAPSPDGTVPAPPNGAPVPPDTAVPPYAAPAKAPKRNPKLIRVVSSLAVAAAVFGVSLWLAQDDPGNAKVGDCVAGATAEEMQIVDCGSGEAKWQVIGRVEDKAQADLESACLPFKEAESAFWQGEEGEKGIVLCLKPTA